MFLRQRCKEEGGVEEFRIHKASREDLASILALVMVCIEAMRARGIDQWDEVYPNELDFSKDLEAGALYVAKAENHVVGCVVLNHIQEPEYASVSWSFTSEPVGVVHRLMIHPERQGNGWGRRLMDYIENRAIELGYRTLRLDAFSENPGACGLYETLKYRDAGRVNFRKGMFHCFEKQLIGGSEERGSRHVT